jgi:hypothetical protein
MTIAREFYGPGWTANQYDELISRMGLDGHSAPGVLFHWASISDDGVHAVDVYESVEAADRLAGDLIGPIAAQLQLAPPEIKQFEVRTVLVPA